MSCPERNTHDVMSRWKYTWCHVQGEIPMMSCSGGCYESVDHSTGVEWNAGGQPKMPLNTSLSIGQKLEHAYNYSLSYWTRVAM